MRTIGAVPTHQDFPWLRDQRAEEELRARGRGHRPSKEAARAAPDASAGTTPWVVVWVTVGLVAAIVVLVLGSAGAGRDEAFPGPPAGVGPAPTPASAAATPDTPTTPRVRTLSRLRSRILDAGMLEVWGRTSLPDGSSIRVSVSSRGQDRVRLPTAPSAGGRFYVRAQLPASLQGRRILIRARAVR